MPNWWLPWAERIAPVLAEAWLRPRPAGGSGPTPPPHPAADPVAAMLRPLEGDPGDAQRDPV